MAESSNLPLFSESDLVQPSGSAWFINPDDPATVPVPLQVVMVKVEGPYTERDRKLWTFLLHAVWDELGETLLHELPVSEINRVFRDLGGDHNTAWIWESARRLAKTTVEWEAKLGDERFEQGISSLFGAVVTKQARQLGKLKFNFPPLLIPIIKQPHRFARLRVHFMMGLSGKYAVTFYELLEGFANTRSGEFRCTIDELRQWLKVPEGTYNDWKDLKKRVVEPSIKQINDDPNGSGFSVTYEAFRKGRSYDRLTFKITKSNQRSQTEKTIKRRVDLAKRIASGQGRGGLVILPHHLEQAAKVTGGYLDMAVIEREFIAHWEATGRQPLKSVEGAFVGFAKKKLRQAKYQE